LMTLFQMHVNEVLARCRAPVPDHEWLYVRQFEGFLEQGIVIEIDLPDRHVVARRASTRPSCGGVLDWALRWSWLNTLEFIASRSCRETLRVSSAQFEVVDALMIVGPVAIAFVMSMKGYLLVSSDRGDVAYSGPAERPLGEINDDLLLAPADALDPFRRDQDLLARQPILRIHDQVADRPGLDVDKEILDVADLAV